MSIKLRPHHLLCIQFFQGKGYSQDFVDNMYNVISQLKDSQSFVLTDTKDSVCASCPLFTNQCADIDKVSRYDNIVIGLLGLSVGDTYIFDEVANKVKREIIDSKLLPTICNDCQYAYICQSKCCK